MERDKLSGSSSCSLPAVSFVWKSAGKNANEQKRARLEPSKDVFAGVEDHQRTCALLAARALDRSITARLCSFVVALFPRNLRAKERQTACSLLQLVRNLARGQDNNIYLFKPQWFEGKESDVKSFYKTLYFILTYFKWFAMVLTPTLLSQWRERSIVHYLPPGKYEPGYHMSKLDTVYIQRINVIQYTIMGDVLTEILSIDKELTTAVRQIDHHLNQIFIWIFSVRSPHEFQM